MQTRGDVKGGVGTGEAVEKFDISPPAKVVDVLKTLFQ